MSNGTHKTLSDWIVNREIGTDDKLMWWGMQAVMRDPEAMQLATNSLINKMLPLLYRQAERVKGGYAKKIIKQKAQYLENILKERKEQKKRSEAHAITPPVKYPRTIATTATVHAAQYILSLESPETEADMKQQCTDLNISAVMKSLTGTWQYITDGVLSMLTVCGDNRKRLAITTNELANEYGYSDIIISDLKRSSRIIIEVPRIQFYHHCGARTQDQRHAVWDTLMKGKNEPAGIVLYHVEWGADGMPSVKGVPMVSRWIYADNVSWKRNPSNLTDKRKRIPDRIQLHCEKMYTGELMKWITGDKESTRGYLQAQPQLRMHLLEQGLTGKVSTNAYRLYLYLTQTTRHNYPIGTLARIAAHTATRGGGSRQEAMRLLTPQLDAFCKMRREGLKSPIWRYEYRGGSVYVSKGNPPAMLSTP